MYILPPLPHAHTCTPWHIPAEWCSGAAVSLFYCGSLEATEPNTFNWLISGTWGNSYCTDADDPNLYLGMEMFPEILVQS